MEAAESLWDNPVYGYAFHKAEAERYLQRVIQTERWPITILRPSLTFGPGAANFGVLRQNYGVVARIRQGKPLVMSGDGSTPFSFTFTPDVAKGFVGVLGNPATYGETYHVCSEERCIWEELYLEVGKIIGAAPHIVHLPAELLYRTAPNLCNHLYFEKTYAGLFDNAKIKRDVPGFNVGISLHDGLHMLLQWFATEACRVDPDKDALEDRLVSLYNHWADSMVNLYTA